MPSGLLDGRFRTLRFRLTFWNTGAILLLVLATLVGLREGLRYTLQRELDRLLAEDMTEVQLALDNHYPDWTKLKEELDRKAISHKARAWFVRIFTPDGKRLLATTGAPGFEVPETATADLPFNVATYRVVQQRLHHPGRPKMVVRVGCSQDFVDDNVLNLSKMLIVAGALFLALAPLSGYWLAGRATRPLTTILETTARIRPGQLDERVPLTGSGDELDRLATTINGLLDRLATHLERQREFVANAAHELRSPLAALRTSAEVALGRDRSPEEYRELLADMMEASEGLGGLVNQLLLLAEGEAGLPHAGTEVALDRLAACSVAMFAGMAEERGLELRAELAAATVVGHEMHLRQIINNLIDNAIKFTPAGGRVMVEVGPAREGGLAVVLLRVRDSGVGIAANDLPHVCERFYRTDKSRQRPATHPGPGGNGLGLSICEAIVSAHGGRFHVESAVGKGTTVTVWLRAARPA